MSGRPVGSRENSLHPEHFANLVTAPDISMESARAAVSFGAGCRPDCLHSLLLLERFLSRDTSFCLTCVHLLGGRVCPRHRRCGRTSIVRFNWATRRNGDSRRNSSKRVREIRSRVWPPVECTVHFNIDSRDTGSSCKRDRWRRSSSYQRPSRKVSVIVSRVESPP